MQPEPLDPVLPLVCALVVSHNCAEALRRTVASLEASEGRERMQILVVDNGSTDGSQRIDAEFPEVTAMRLPHHCGLTKARNIGIRTAKAEYLLLLEPGVVVEPRTAMALAARLEAESGALAVCPALPDSRVHELPSAEEVARHWQSPASLHDGRAMLLRRGTIQGMNYLDEKFGEHWGDVELAYQIKRAGKRILLAPDIPVSSSGAPLWRPAQPSDRAAYAADAAGGAAAYLGKHFGFGASLGFRVKLILGTLIRTVTFQDFGYHSSLLSRLCSGYKIDGSSQRL